MTLSRTEAAVLLALAFFGTFAMGAAYEIWSIR
jgi:hypothetical protein